jgi:phosphoenolpyruvate carboxylase
MLPAWLGSAEALRYANIKEFRKTLYDMERNWPFFNSMLDILDMVISKVDPDISKIYEEYLADEKLKRVGKRLRFQFDVIKKLNKEITPNEIIKSRKQFRTSVIVRNIYSEILNIIQPIVIKKIKTSKNKVDKKYLNDALLNIDRRYFSSNEEYWIDDRIINCICSRINKFFVSMCTTIDTGLYFLYFRSVH